MREIKFRGRSIDPRQRVEEYFFKMVYGQLINKYGEYFIPAPGGTNLRIDDETIGQYTGLKDKNCKEIYEGDILLNRTEEFGDIYSKVIFLDGCFMVLEPECEYAELTVAEMVDDVEVVGNIYENPKLLRR